ncbi:anillin isoform X1 [Hippocampus comes]|uniref:anillin isoform X1 n=1 Tax=Hippocampus comes TaxID=109280 RepID=UPI00094E1EA3|nr:PREDICTED: anillin isoform X1 [Hippocampus comes]
MDPFTEKLLERTRARRENLQKKMAGRPNAAERKMEKRPREPLADKNDEIMNTNIAEVPQRSSKPSPSKRRCSSENVEPAEEKNTNTQTQPTIPVLPDPPTDKKPPIVPACARPTSSAGVTEAQLFAQAQPVALKTVQPMSENITVTAPPKMETSILDEIVTVHPVVLKSTEDPMEVSAPPATRMKSRLQKLAEQRKCWEGPDLNVEDSAPLSRLRTNVDVTPTSGSITPSEIPVRPREKLAMLAATIGNWEDDLSHVNISKEKAPTKPAPAFGSKSAGRDAYLSAVDPVVTSSTERKYAPLSNQVAALSARSTPQKTCTPATKSTPNSEKRPQKPIIQAAAVPLESQKKTETPATNSTPDSVTRPQKPSRQPAVVPTESPSSQSVLHSSLETDAVGNFASSHQKTQLCAKPTTSSPAGPPAKKTVGGPGVQVKTLLDRFGDRCQERTNSPAGRSIQQPTVNHLATPSNNLVQNRLMAAQATKTTTADFTQKQKLERETELAQIRNRPQVNNMWKIIGAGSETKKTTDLKEKLDKSVDSNIALFEPKNDPKPPSIEAAKTPGKGSPPGCGILVCPPASTSSPMRTAAHTDKDKIADISKHKDHNEDKEIEMNVDHSINSTVINDLFDGVLEQSEDQDDDDDEEEDALNMSSMSLLTPLAETVSAVVKSPERMMTSTPASSFIVKNNTPDKVCQPSTFQRPNIRSTASDVIDENLKLPYSVDAYRSTRVKEHEKPSAQDVVLKKEVSDKAEELRGSSLLRVKQKLKILTNEMNLQQTVIHQASQALNCCTDEEHGKGSQVEAEAERLLLVATEKREALKTELQRLKGEGPAGQKKTPLVSKPTGISASRGSICLQEIRLPLKADFVCATANKPESMKHSFFVMIRAGAENTVATPLSSTHCGLSGDTLTFPTKFTLSDVSSEFAIDIEVYCLVQKREISGDKKKKPSKSKAITPKRFLAITKSGQTPVLASPGGPNAVRTSNFVLLGYHHLTLSSIGENKFPLEKVPFMSPLEGHIYLRMQCQVGSQVEERGFLTMFEDVSGFGAWHRRWCVLSGYCIAYWTYPDDEKRKNPIGRINLANCISKRVEPVNREFCARPNTFELVTVRPQRQDDKETLVSQCQNSMCVTKNWLSADTKDERTLWLSKLNQILVDLRMWQPGACSKPL